MERDIHGPSVGQSLHAERQRKTVKELRHKLRELSMALEELMKLVNQATNPNMGMDEQELGEREEAAQQLSEEHLVDYLNSCVEESDKAHEEIRRTWSELWDCSENKMDFSGKEDWQAQIALDKPHSTVQQAKAIVRKALVDTKKFWSCEPLGKGKRDKLKCEIWDKAFEFWLSPCQLNFVALFPDAADLGFRIGISHYLKLIPRKNEEGRYKLDMPMIEPWKIHRDPDSLPRQPWSGMYMVHQDYVDWHVLKVGEQEGRFQFVDRVRDQASEAEKGKEGQDKESIMARRMMSVARHRFRKSYLTSELWGDVLGPKGDLILPNATYTTAAQTVIRGPYRNPYDVRWPLVAFSPIPHPLRWDGKGILNGVKVLWKLANQLFSLHADNLNWSLNKSYEVNMNGLVDPTDTERYPGKWYFTKLSEHVFKEIAESSKTPETLQNLDALFKLWQEFSFVSEFVAAIPSGDNTDRTARETEIKTSRALGIFDSIASDLEAGIVWFLTMLYEVLFATWDINDTPEAQAILGDDLFMLMWYSGMMSPKERRAMIKAEMEIKVSGVSAYLVKADLLAKFKFLLTLLNSPIFVRFFKHYETARVITETMDLQDKGVLKTEEEVAQDMQAEMQMQQQQAQAQRGQQLSNKIIDTELEKEKKNATQGSAIQSQANPQGAGPFGL